MTPQELREIEERAESPDNMVVLSKCIADRRQLLEYVRLLEKRNQEGERWIAVEDALPESGVTVLASYLNRGGKSRTVRAEWVAAKSVEVNDEHADCGWFGDYDEEADCYWCPEGWYEAAETCPHEDGHLSKISEAVTHWMPMPAKPERVLATQEGSKTP